jgi:hypothetical protein
MSVDSRLDILPKFQIQAISPGKETTLVTGAFTQVKGLAVDHRGWLFVSESESSIADIVTLEGKVASLVSLTVLYTGQSSPGWCRHPWSR